MINVWWNSQGQYGNAVEVGPDGSVYVAAVSAGGLTPVGDYGEDSFWVDPLVLKYTPSLGAEVWHSNIVVSGEEVWCNDHSVIPEALAFDAQGKIYVAATWAGCLKNPEDGLSAQRFKVYRLTANGERDFFGEPMNAIMQATYYSGSTGGPGYGADSDVATGIVVAPDGSFYVSGYISNYRPANKKTGITENTKEDWRVVKFNADGTPNAAWNDNPNTRFDSGGDDRAEGVMVGNDGNIYVVGIIDRSSGNSKVRLVKYNAQNGDILNQSVSPSPFVYITGATMNRSGEIYVGKNDGGAMKFSPSLQLLWNSPIGGLSTSPTLFPTPTSSYPSYFYSEGIAADDRGGIYIAGTQINSVNNTMGYRTFKVQESTAPSVSVAANPASGPVPLTSRITADVFGLQAALPQKQIGSLLAERADAAAGDITYRFDCGNGAEPAIINTTATTAASDCIFESVRTFHVTVRVTYPEGTTYPAGTIEGSVNIPVREVAIPSVSVTLAADPSSGPAPLIDVRLAATPSFSPGAEELLTYKFYCYEGAEEPSEQSSNTTECDYQTAGVYTPSVMVVGQQSGRTASNTATVTATATSFTVSLKAIPSFGQRPLNDVDLVATLLSPQTDVVYEFDCGDGTIWSPPLPIDGQSYTAVDRCDYGVSGVYTAKVTATNGAGNSAEGTAVVNVYTRIEPDPN